MSKINKVSSLFNLLFKFLIIFYPAIVISMWFGLISIPSGYFSFSRLPIPVDFNSLTSGIRIAACSAQMISTIIVIMEFYYLSRLFKLYSKNMIFGLENIKLIRKIGTMLVAQVIASIVAVQPLISMILTIDAAPGQHMISIGVSSDEISNLLIGGIVILISWIMAEGRKLADEQALTI